MTFAVNKQATYLPFGYSSANPQLSLLGFNGEPWLEPLARYSLAGGRRFYCPRLARFMTADSMSPFGAGGVNCYGYCGGDPVNYRDPSGHIRVGRFRPWRSVKQEIYKFVDSRSPRGLQFLMWGELDSLERLLVTRRLVKNSKQAFIKGDVPLKGVRSDDVDSMRTVYEAKARIVSGEETSATLSDWNIEFDKTVHQLDSNLREVSRLIRNDERYAGKKLGVKNAF